MTAGYATSRKLAAEALGTTLLVCAVVGSGIMAQRLTNDEALALLCNTIPTGAALVVLISVFGPVSGAHFNPVVTLVFALRGDLRARLAAFYIMVQIAGGVLGTIASHLMFALPLISPSTHVRTGVDQWLSESIAAFGLVAVVLLALRAKSTEIPMLVGLYITAAYWFTASTSFANPAVTIARSLTDTFSGIRPIDVPGFVVAQIVGALIALALVSWFARGLEDA